MFDIPLLATTGLVFGMPFAHQHRGLQFGVEIPASTKVDIGINGFLGNMELVGSDYSMWRKAMNLSFITAINPIAESSSERGFGIFAGPAVQFVGASSSQYGVDFGAGVEFGVRSLWGRTEGWFGGVEWFRWYQSIASSSKRNTDTGAVFSVQVGYVLR